MKLGRLRAPLPSKARTRKRATKEIARSSVVTSPAHHAMGLTSSVFSHQSNQWFHECKMNRTSSSM